MDLLYIFESVPHFIEIGEVFLQPDHVTVDIPGKHDGDRAADRDPHHNSREHRVKHDAERAWFKAVRTLSEGQTRGGGYRRTWKSQIQMNRLMKKSSLRRS